jgi:DMSO/TMAO reductase YedYZ molybdopterin-dependent catalytic subunit
VTDAGYETAWFDRGYTTELTVEDIAGGWAWVANEYAGEPIDPEHGGPGRLLVPHLYFRKSAKWVWGLNPASADRPGSWENHGCHNHGDPWLEQRHQGD